jgi:peptide/nickel transport system permease protein
MSAEHRPLEQEPSVAINLSRRKKRVRALRASPREQIAPYATLFRIAIDRLKRSRIARAGALVVACLAMIAVFADVLANDLPIACRFHGATFVLPALTQPQALDGYDNARILREKAAGDWLIAPIVTHGPSPRVAPDPSEALVPPLSPGHALGTDAFGRDVLARILYGTRTALTLGALAVLAFASIGLVLGALAGFFRGVLDAAVARVIETLSAFPTLVLVLVVQAIVPGASTFTLLVAIGLTRWTEVARLVRAEVLAASHQDYVTAARALGASPWRVLRRHVLPNSVAPAIVATAFGVAQVVLVEAALDFLRVGAPNVTASWGETLSEARDHAGAWWLLAFPGAMLFITVAALNLVGEALRDALDPRLRDGRATTNEIAAASGKRESMLPPPTAA